MATKNPIILDLDKRQVFLDEGVKKSEHSTGFNWSSDNMGQQTYVENKEKQTYVEYEHTFYPWLCDNIFNYKRNIEEGLGRINPNINPYDNGISVDFVGRYEQLDEDIDYIGEKLGLKLKLPQINSDTRDKTKKIHEYYDEETTFYIEDYFKYDLDKFWKPEGYYKKDKL